MPWGLAGLWSEWRDPQTGQTVLSCTMLTQHCDGHPVLGLMHKPEPTLPRDQQDKRSMIPPAAADWQQWLTGRFDEALRLVKVPHSELILHGAADPAMWRCLSDPRRANRLPPLLGRRHARRRSEQPLDISQARQTASPDH